MASVLLCYAGLRHLRFVAQATAADSASANEARWPAGKYVVSANLRAAKGQKILAGKHSGIDTWLTAMVWLRQSSHTHPAPTTSVACSFDAILRRNVVSRYKPRGELCSQS